MAKVEPNNKKAERRYEDFRNEIQQRLYNVNADQGTAKTFEEIEKEADKYIEEFGFDMFSEEPAKKREMKQAASEVEETYISENFPQALEEYGYSPMTEEQQSVINERSSENYEDATIAEQNKKITWEEVKNKNTIESYKQYVNDNPNSDHIAEAEDEIGKLYYFDEKDYEKSFTYFKKSADRGYPNAQNNLAVMYKIGKGTTQDYKEARNWYEKAVSQGYAPAQRNLSNLNEYEKQNKTLDDLVGPEMYQEGNLQSSRDALRPDNEERNKGFDIDVNVMGDPTQFGNLYEEKTPVQQNAGGSPSGGTQQGGDVYDEIKRVDTPFNNTRRGVKPSMPYDGSLSGFVDPIDLYREEKEGVTINEKPFGWDNVTHKSPSGQDVTLGADSWTKAKTSQTVEDFAWSGGDPGNLNEKAEKVFMDLATKYVQSGMSDKDARLRAAKDVQNILQQPSPKKGNVIMGDPTNTYTQGMHYSPTMR